MKAKYQLFLKMPIAWLLFGWNFLLVIGFFKMLLGLGRFMLGMWRCERCNKLMNVKDEKYQVGVNNRWTTCQECHDDYGPRLRPPAPAAQGFAISKPKRDRPPALLPVPSQQARERGM